MKKINFTEADANAAFECFCRQLEQSENKKDRFLKAARLQRVERQPMSDARFEMIMWFLFFAFGLTAFLLFLLMLS